MAKNQEHRILEFPRNIPIEHIKPRKEAIIDTANDFYFIESHDKAFGNIILGSIFFLSGLWILSLADSFDFVVGLVSLYPLSGLFLIIKGLFKPKKKYAITIGSD